MFTQINTKKKLFFLALILLPLLTINMERTPGQVKWYAQPFALTANILQNTLFSAFYGTGQLASTYFDLVDVKRQNQQLTKENNYLALKLQATLDLKKENNRLRSLLKFQQNTKMKLLPAQVIGNDSQKKPKQSLYQSRASSRRTPRHGGSSSPRRHWADLPHPSLDLTGFTHHGSLLCGG